MQPATVVSRAEIEKTDPNKLGCRDALGAMESGAGPERRTIDMVVGLRGGLYRMNPKEFQDVIQSTVDTALRFIPPEEHGAFVEKLWRAYGDTDDDSEAEGDVANDKC
jgi:hypothetical protein